MAAEFSTLALASDPNLKSYYTLEDVNDDYDGRNLTNVGSVAFNSAKFNNGADLGASNSSKCLYYATDFGTAGTAYTWSGWVKLQTEISSGSYYFFYMCESSTDTQRYVRYDYNSGTRRLVFSRNRFGVSGGYSSIVHELTMGTSEWYHLALTYDGTIMNAYVNGEHVGTIGATGNGTTGLTNISLFGAYSTSYPGSISSHASAIFDDFAIFNRALTEAEVQSIYNGVDPDLYSLDLESSSNQYASIADASQTGLDISTDITLEAWIKVESMPSAGQVRIIMGKMSDQSSQQSYRLDISDTGTVGFIVNDNGTWTDGHRIWYKTGTGLITAGQWYHVAYTFDISTETARSYINGVEVSNSISTGTTIGANLYDSSAPFAIGIDYNSSGVPRNHFDGLIDEARVWSDVRTSQEIIDNMAKDVTGEANLQGYWKLNNDYTDSSSNGNDLTASGSPAFSTQTPFPAYTAVRQSALSATDLFSDANLQGYYKFDTGALTTDSSSGGNTLTNNNSASETTGLYSGAVSLNGSNQYLNVANDLGIDGNDDITISGWVKMNAEISAGVDIFWHHSSTTAVARWFQVYYNYNSGNRRIQFDNGGSSTGTLIYCTLGTSEWQHFTFVRAGTVGRAYVNGVPIGTVTQGASAAGGSYLRLGVDAASNYGNLSLDDIAVFNRALSDQEVLDIYTGTATAGGNFFLMF